jgi:hypothetical protein
MRFDVMRFTAASDASPLADSVLRALEQGGDFDVPSLRAQGFRALTPMIDKANIAMDRAVIKVGLQRLTFVADLLSEGLTYNLPDPLSVTLLEWQKTGRVGAAYRTMTPSSRYENKLPQMLPARLPIYLTMDGFDLDIRTLKVSQRMGTPLDTTLIEACTRAVNEAIEDAAINGTTTLDGQDLVVTGYNAPGLLNAPNANQQVLTISAWTGAAPNGTVVQQEILAMITKLQNDKKYGPYNLYVPPSVSIPLNMDFKANGNDSIYQRLLEINVGSRNLRIRPTDMMPANKVALVQMTSDVIEIVDGQRPTVIPWTSLNGFKVHNVVMGIMVPRVRSDMDGNSGICIGTISGAGTFGATDDPSRIALGRGISDPSLPAHEGRREHKGDDEGKIPGGENKLDLPKDKK